MTSLESLERALASSDPEQRRRGVAELPACESEGRAPLLLAALGDPDWRVRKEAVGVAVALAPASDMLSALVEVLKPGENVGLRNAVVEALAGYTPDLVQALDRVLPDLDADGRKLAAEALGRSEHPEALRLLENLSTDPDANVRGAAVEAIAQVGTTCADEAGELLIACLKSHDRFQRLAALNGLNELGVTIRWDSLEALEGDPVLQRAFVSAAGRSEDERAAPVLARMLSENPSLEVEVLQSLAELVRLSPGTHGAVRDALVALPAVLKQHILDLASGAGTDHEGRRHALLLTAIQGGHRAASLAADALLDDRVAADAEAALEILGREGVNELNERAKSGSHEARAVWLELLGRLAADTPEAAIDTVLKALDDPSPDVAAAAFNALCRVGDDTCLDAAARFLNSDAPVSVRKGAAAAVAAISGRHPAAARKLALRARPTEAEAYAAAVAMSSLPPPVLGSMDDDIKFLSEALSNSNTLVRRAALEALAENGSEPAVEAVAFALTDEELDVQLAAVRALGRIRGQDGSVVGITHLLDLVERSEDDEVVTTAIQALGDAADPRALALLRPLVREGSAVQAVAAVEAFGRTAGPRRVDALIEALSHHESEVVKAALRELAVERDPRAVTHLGACLDHEAWDVRRLSADLLGRIGGDANVNLLRVKLATESEPLVREAIQRALDSAGVGRRTLAPPKIGSFRSG